MKKSRRWSQRIMPVFMTTLLFVSLFPAIGVAVGSTDLVAGRTSVISPEYRSEISGDTVVEFINPGGTSAIVYAQKQPDDVSIVDTNGTRELVAEIELDESGYGSFIFPADDFPNGPVTLRIQVWKDGTIYDNAYLQLYNTGGVAWKQGLDNAPVNPVTEGMAVVFEDDFKVMPAITLDGIDADYASRKVDEHRGGMFGWAAFEDFGGAYDPFEIVDGEYMKLTTTYRPDYNIDGYWGQKVTTGYLSSMDQDGGGFKTEGGRNQYFEARIFSGPNPGLWPAFWTLTANGYANNPQPFDPSDELDILEGYMGSPETYQVAWHQWDYGTGLGGGARPNLETEAFNHINMAMGFHTFAVYITEQTTYYYCDNIEVASHPTLPYSWELGNYFIINAALSDHFGIDGNADPGEDPFADFETPFGFTRYGNESATYIDWVRVYQDLPGTPRFETNASSVNASPGQIIQIPINRNHAAQALSGVYEIALPDDWELIVDGSGATEHEVPFAAGSAQDTLTMVVPQNYDDEDGTIVITPVLAGGERLIPIRITAEGPDSEGTLVRIDANTYRYRSITGGSGGPWSQYDPSTNEKEYFTVNSGGWWSQGWSWMHDRVLNEGELSFKFEGVSAALYNINFDGGGTYDVYLNGTHVKTVNTYSLVEDSNVLGYQVTGLPMGEHEIIIRTKINPDDDDEIHVRFSGFEYRYYEDPTIPKFAASVSNVDAIPGENISINIIRNIAALTTFGRYEVVTPDGDWEVVSGTNFSTNHPVDTIVLKVPDNYQNQAGRIEITPVMGENQRLNTMTIIAKAPDPEEAPELEITGERRRIDQDTYPHIKDNGDGGGSWLDFDHSSQSIDYFDFGSFNWWNDGWGYMYLQVDSSGEQNVKFTFEGAGVAIYAVTFDEGGDFDVYLNGDHLGTISTQATEKPVRVFSIDGLPVAEHELEVRIIANSGSYVNLAAFEYDYVAADGSVPPIPGEAPELEVTGELRQINSDTYPHIKINGDGGGSWLDFDHSSQPIDYFDFGGFNWWNDGWGYMYLQVDSSEEQNLKFSFEGAGAAIYATMFDDGSDIGNSFGSDFAVYLNGDYVQTVNTQGSRGRTRVFSVDGLPAAHHELELRVIGTTGTHIKLDAFEYDYVAAETQEPQIIEVNANSYPYWNNNAEEGEQGHGAWSAYDNPDEPQDSSFSFDFGLGGNWWSDGWSWMYALANSVLEFQFEGTSIAVSLIQDEHGGDVEIYLNGILEETINTSNETVTEAVLFEKDGLPAAEHTLQLKNVDGDILRVAGFTYTFEPAVIGIPQFAAATSSIAAASGQEISIGINRNAEAQLLSGDYEVVFPDSGWSVVSGTAFSEGSSEDIITLRVSDNYVDQEGRILVTPVTAQGDRLNQLVITARAVLAPPDDIITLFSPEYRADIEGETVLDFIFPGGYVQAEAFSLVSSENDVVSLGDAVELDEQGNGSITFDAELLPRGPVAIRVIATKPDGTRSIDNYLQFYNLGGTLVSTGLADAPLPPQLEGMGMELLFADDFTTMPTISRDGLDGEGNPTTYIAHKPDYLDYGGAQFADFEGPHNPFHQLDDYLRITTAYEEDLVDQYDRKHYTGFLASVNRQGEGITTDGYVNQYFEARFFTGANPGLWPAFWTLSANNYAGTTEPSVELDIIEGYMAWPDGYAVAAHAWGDGNPQQGQGGGGRILTEELFGQKGNIAMGFHTYGLLITEDKTYYYFNDEVVYERPTLHYSWTEGNYFMINSALSDHSFPQGYGFERYGDESHMFIDWVRVYQQPADPDAVRFTAADVRLREVEPGGTLEVVINRNATAQALSGEYQVELPAGWVLVSDSTFEEGADSDTLIFQISEDYVLYRSEIVITPVADGISYSNVIIRTQTNTPFDIDVYPVLNSAGNGWDVAIQLNNGFESADLSAGYIEVIEPEEAIGQYPFDSIPANGSVKVSIPGAALELLETTLYSFRIVREDGYEREVERTISNLTVVRADTPIVIDGIVDEDEWAGAVEIVLGADATRYYTSGRPWRGEEDISAVGRLKWDNEHLYFSVVVKDDIHFQNSEVISAWGSDSLQFSIDPGRKSGYGTEGGTRFIAAVHSTDGTYGLALEDRGQLAENPSTDLVVNRRDEAAKTTTYELALKWSEILHPGDYPPEVGSTNIGFSFLINDNDGDAHGRVGWIEYMAGIGVGKHADQFGDLILTNRTALEAVVDPDPDPDPEQPDKTDLEAAIDSAESLYPTGYTTSSWSDLMAALAAAKDVFEDEDATELEVNSALEALQAAVTNLRWAWVIPPTDPEDPTDPVDPTEPTDPEEPVDPTDPEEPVDPVDPTDPEAPTDLYFDDVTEQWFWAAQQINYLYEHGIVLGIGNNQFGPELQVRRGDFILMLVRAFDLEAEIETNFVDVPDTSYYYEAIAIAKSLGIVLGNGTNFYPEASITRQDMIVIIDRLLDILEQPLSDADDSILDRFADEQQISDYARDSAARLVQAGLIIGTGTGLNPLESTTRAELAVVLYRLLQ